LEIAELVAKEFFDIDIAIINSNRKYNVFRFNNYYAFDITELAHGLPKEEEEHHICVVGFIRTGLK
jgi:hypothetical protein